MKRLPEGSEYQPSLEELREAEVTPAFDNPEWSVPDELLGWVIYYAETWKPVRKPEHGRWLKEPLTYRGFQYEGIVWKEGKPYIVDAFAFRIMHAATGEKTAFEIISSLLAELVAKTLPEDHPNRRAFETGKAEGWVKEGVDALIALAYRHLAMLKEKGLIE